MEILRTHYRLLQTVLPATQRRCINIFQPALSGKGCDPERGCDMCKIGYSQSPVEIDSRTAEETELPPLRFANHFNSETNLNMVQAGNTVLIKVGQDCPMTMEGGPLNGSYLFDQLHFHWGTSDDNGSEHMIDKKKYGMEINLVYYNCIYGCVENAVNQPDGIAMLGVLMESRPTHHNCFMDGVVNCLFRLTAPGVSVPLAKNILKMFKDTFDSQDYYTYEGSLLNPPCCEDVIWIVFKRAIGIHCAQVDAFRHIVNASGKEICSNTRDLQSLNGRTIYNVISPCPCSDPLCKKKSSSKIDCKKDEVGELKRPGCKHQNKGNE